MWDIVLTVPRLFLPVIPFITVWSFCTLQIAVINSFYEWEACSFSSSQLISVDH